VIYTNADANFRGRTFTYRADTTPDALKVYRKYGRASYFAR
jgi:hypothetical protein